VESEVQLQGGVTGRAIVPAGASAAAWPARPTRGGWWPAFNTSEEALDALVESVEHAGYVPERQVAIALDIAASDFGQGGRCTLGLERRELDSDGLIESLLRWCERFPIVSIEDPLAENDPAACARFTAAVGHRMQVVGDDFLVSGAALFRQAAQAFGYAAIVSVRSGETEDTTIVDLSIGWQEGQLKVGSLARSEHMAKWNAVLCIEEAAGAAGRFAGAGMFGRRRRGINAPPG
jgi:enolase